MITYAVKSVQAVLDTTATPDVKRSQITFKLKRDGADVVFQTYVPSTTTELVPNFVGSPSVYFAFAVPRTAASPPTSTPRPTGT